MARESPRKGYESIFIAWLVFLFSSEKYCFILNEFPCYTLIGFSDCKAAGASWSGFISVLCVYDFVKAGEAFEGTESGRNTRNEKKKTQFFFVLPIVIRWKTCTHTNTHGESESFFVYFFLINYVSNEGQTLRCSFWFLSVENMM